MTAAEPTLPLEPSEIEIRAAEATRFRDVDVAPAIPAPKAAREPATLRASSGVLGLQGAAAASTLERSRSALWPLVLALIVGLAIGFASGYGVGTRDRATTIVAVPPPPSSPAARPTSTSGREFTDAAVNEPSKTDVASVQREAPAPAKPPVIETPRPSATAAASSPALSNIEGHLLVRSTPSGARVFIDGRDHGRTPTTVRDLARGPHRVRVVQDGYVTQERRVVVSGSRLPQTLSLALVRARPEPSVTRRASDSFSGSLSVDSLPPGARVFVDGRPIGTTPMLLPEIGAGEHVVRLERDGYRKWSSSVRVVAGERNRVTASLEK